jgi:PKD repeat protein
MEFGCLNKLLVAVSLFAMTAGTGPAAVAADDPLLVTYGARAATQEGDHDHRQVVYISIPETRTEPVFVRLFDPDTAGSFDTALGAWQDSTTRFSVFGGAGAFAAPASFDAPLHDGGTLLAERDYGASSALDGQWTLFATLDPAQGDLVHDRRVFRLEVDGFRGDDGNVYDIFASLVADANLWADGVEMFTYVPTVRVPDDDLLTELRFIVPSQTTDLTVHNFDASGAEVAFSTPFRTVPLEPSGQDDWKAGRVALEAIDQGRVAALTLRHGEEIPNDISLYVTGSDGALVPLELPAHRWAPNVRPQATLTVTPTDCRFVEFEVIDLRDADDDKLRTIWYFHDDAIIGGDAVRYVYDEPGAYEARVEVLDESGVVANGWARDFLVEIKAPPVARISAPTVVAQGAPVRLDGTASHSASYDIATYEWHFSDGRPAHGAFVNHIFNVPGTETIALAVTDAANHPCNGDQTEFNIRVNARPVADAGRDRHLGVGETVSFDLGASADPDGDISSVLWDFGDGVTSDVARPEHAYAAPGEYHVALRVDDGTGVSNARGLDVARVIVNAPPVAEAGEALSPLIGEIVTFDAARSYDPDGSITDYLWTLGDGTTKSGAVVTHAYRAVGEYLVSLKVTDSSGRDNGAGFDHTSVIVRDTQNVMPRAAAGPDISAAVGEVIEFDAGASQDSDGNIIIYDWQFGDGGTSHGVSARHVYLNSGTYAVQLTVRDNSGKPNDTDEDELTVRVYVPTNAAPVAAAGDDLAADVGQVITFDASASHDSDGNVVVYEWDFGDGASGVGVAPTYSYFAEGQYQVTLTVRDDSALQGLDTDTITVTVTGQQQTDGQ